MVPFTPFSCILAEGKFDQAQNQTALNSDSTLLYFLLSERNNYKGFPPGMCLLFKKSLRLKNASGICYSENLAGEMGWKAGPESHCCLAGLEMWRCGPDQCSSCVWEAGDLGWRLSSTTSNCVISVIQADHLYFLSLFPGQ